MPELPEIEAIKRVLEPQLKGRGIRQILVNRPEVVAHPEANAFCGQLTGQTFDHIQRRGKFLILGLAGGDRIIIHLRMTGALLQTPVSYLVEKHTHLIFRLDNDQELRFMDTRRFGRFWLLQKDEADTYSGIEKLGKEPFDTDFSPQYLRLRLGKRKKAIKECLLDQGIVAGIGNIYSDEILFEAKIHPSRPASTLTDDEWARLAAAIPSRLAFFIEKNEITPEEYLETKGQDYRNTPFLQVYGQDKKPCPLCGEALCKTVIGGRSSVYCPSCQK